MIMDKKLKHQKYHAILVAQTIYYNFSGDQPLNAKSSCNRFINAYYNYIEDFFALHIIKCISVIIIEEIGSK